MTMVQLYKNKEAEFNIKGQADVEDGINKLNKVSMRPCIQTQDTILWQVIETRKNITRGKTIEELSKELKQSSVRAERIVDEMVKGCPNNFTELT